MKSRVAIFFILPLIFILLYGGGTAVAEDGNIAVSGVDLLIAPGPGFEPVRFFMAGDPKVKRVALTFDDSPNPYYSESLVRILKEKGVRATFFCMGNKSQLYPDLLVRILIDGHELGNHSYSHPKLDSIPREDWEEEILYTNRILKRVLGYDCRLFRPPHGRYTEDILDFVYAHGMTTCGWTVNTGDYLEPAPQTMINKVMNSVKPGGVIMMHDGTDTTIEALPALIDKLTAQGYEFVTIGEMIGGRIVF